MKKSFILSLLTAAFVLTACENDDQYTLSELQTIYDANYSDVSDISSDTIYIAWSGNTATVTSDSKGYVSVSGARVTVNSTATDMLTYVLSGSTTDGQLLIYSVKKLELILNNVEITNPTGPAINNQCGKSLFITCAAGTTNTLTDGTAYTDAYNNGVAIDQKGALFSEGQIIFRGSGTLNVNGNYKNAIASDDYVVIDSTATCTLNAKAAATASNGIKVNDGMFVYGGTLSIDVKANGARGIKCDSIFTMTGGTLDISTSGNPVIETDATTGLPDTTSCACIRTAGLTTIAGGTITMNSSGDGGKCINADLDIMMTGGTLMATTTGSNDIASPKAIKTEKNIYISGGSFTATVRKSRATDCANIVIDEYDEELRLPIITGTPKTQTLKKKLVEVIF